MAVIEQGGTIALLMDGTHWLDLRDHIADAAPERGLLGVAFALDAHWLFVSYSRADDAATTLARIPLVAGVPQPYANHNGGHIAFWLPEVVAQGLRNPWRFGFGADGSFWVADVGQGHYEELNVIPLSQLPGADFGWSEREGAHCRDVRQPCLTDGLVDPVSEYDHSAGYCSITGGAVVPAHYTGLGGSIMYGDFCAGTISVWDPLHGTTLLIDTDYRISSFRVDANGDVYVSDHGTGNVYRIGVAPSP